MTNPTLRRVAIIGGGPAGLMAAEVIAQDANCVVTIYDAMPSVGRKFLMAGRGGLNLTHSEPMGAFVARYRKRAEVMRPLIEAWSPDDVRAWCKALGQQTFIGSSGRVFPKVMKASGLLRAWLRRLDGSGVTLKTRHRWTGWDNDGGLVFGTPAGNVTVRADATVLALGGASWPRVGSDGAWVPWLINNGIELAPLQPANAGFQVPWSSIFRDRFEGQPIKSISVTCSGGLSARGEAIITAAGIEGGAVYAVSAGLRDALLSGETTTLSIDLKPDVDHATLTSALSRMRGKLSMATFLRKTARLSPVAIGLLQEAAFASDRPLGQLVPDALATDIKAACLPIHGMSAIERAISSAGGVGFDEIDVRFMLGKRPGVFVAGEMLDWEAPTGGYLLQACFATGVAAGRGVRDWLTESHD